MADDPIGQAIGWVGTAMAIFLFLAPLPTMRKVSRARSTLEFSATPFLVSTLNCGLWSVYALPMITPDRYQSLVCNVFGLVMEVAYICHFLRFAANRRALWLRLAGAVATLAALVGIAIALDAAAVPFPCWPHAASECPRVASNVLGWMASVFNILMYAAPLTIMADVLRTRSVQFMPLPLTLAVLCCSSAWLVYALYVMDPFILIPNVSGVGLGVLQVCLYTYVAGIVGERKELLNAVSDADAINYQTAP